ncbi:MAG: terminase TerL endonuclease subunit [Oscillospiraceae bacterium]
MVAIQNNRAYKYALWCVEEDNRYVGYYIKKQCKSWLEIADGKSEEAYICEKTYRKIVKLLKLIVHPDLHCSMFEGLEDYQMLLILATFCTKSREDNTRFYQIVLLEIARKNFKTFVSAVIFIIGMLTEPRFSRFFSVAPDLKLSKELQVAIKKIIKSSPLLSTGARNRVFNILRSEIRCDITESEFTPLAYSQDKMDGKLANMFLADEDGAMDSYPVEAMSSSQITLKEKLGIIISTQYPNDNNGFIDEIDKSKKVLDGLNSNKRRFSLLYEPDIEFMSGEQWKTNDLVIYQANPAAYAHEHIMQALLEKREDAIVYENKRENFLCKHCNIKFKSLGTSGFIDITDFRQCRIVENKEFWKGKRVYIGVDLSLSEDNTAVAMVCFHEGRIYAKAWGFIPAEKLEEKSKKEHVDYSRIIKSGGCFACGDRIVDYKFIEEFVLSLPEKYGVTIEMLGFDKWNAVSSVQKWEAKGIECCEIKQHSSTLHVPTKLLKEQVLSRLFAYEENTLLEINIQNARCTEDTNLNKYVNKKRSSGKVDLVVSIINAIYLLNVEVILKQGADWTVQT